MSDFNPLDRAKVAVHRSSFDLWNGENAFIFGDIAKELYDFIKKR